MGSGYMQIWVNNINRDGLMKETKMGSGYTQIWVDEIHRDELMTYTQMD